MSEGIFCPKSAHAADKIDIQKRPADSIFSLENENFRQTLKKEILPNGLSVILYEDHSHPVVSAVLSVKAGLSYEGTYASSGISHFIEHMAFKGTSKRKPGEVEKEIKSYGGMINASTGLDTIDYYVTVPKEYAENGLELMEDIVFNPAFDERELEKERDVILKEIRLTNDDPLKRVMRQLWETSYLAHPYKFPVIGYEDLFAKLSKKDLVEYHASRYGPENMVLVIAGDIDAGKIIGETKRLFGKHKRKGNLNIAPPLEARQNSMREIKGVAEINLGYLAHGYHTVSLTDNDLYALDVLAIILGDWDGSRLKKNLVKDKQLLYTVSSYNYTPQYPGLFIIYGVGLAERLEESKKEIFGEIEKIALAGVEKNELETAKNIVLSGYIDAFETTDGMARMLCHSEIMAGDPLFFKKYVEKIKELDSEKIRQAATAYLNNDNATVSYLYPDYIDVATEGAAESKAQEAGSQERPPQKFVLSNGVRLILKEDHRIPKVALVCIFLGGITAETAENNGISNLTSALLLKGTKNRTESEIAAYVESRGGKLAHFSGKNSFGITCDFLSGETENTLDLLEDIIQNPSFPQEEIDKEKEKIYAAIKAEEDDIYSAGFLRLRKNLFGNHPYALRIIGEEDSVKRLTIENIKNFYQRFCVPGNAVISVVGDFKTAEMKHSLEKRFAKMKGASLVMETVKPEPLSGEKAVRFEMNRQQSLALVGFRGTTLQNPDKHNLDILCTVLSGENGRLYQVIRNKLGLAYALGASSSPGINTGYVLSYAATDKDNLEKVRIILLEELKGARDGVISPEEIAEGKALLLGHYKIALQSNNALSYRMALDELYGTGYDDYLNYPGYIEKITVEDVATTAKKYLDFENFVSVGVAGISSD